MRSQRISGTLVLALSLGVAACQPPDTPAQRCQRIRSGYSHTGLAGPALEQTGQLLRQWPEDTAVRRCHARMLYDAGKRAGAEAEARRVLDDPDASAYDRMSALVLQAKLAFGRGDWTSARDHSAAALAVDPASAWPMVAEARRLQDRSERLLAMGPWSRREMRHCVVHARSDTAVDVEAVAARADATLERLGRELGVDPGGVDIVVHDSADEARDAEGTTGSETDPRTRQIHVVYDEPLGTRLARLASARLGDLLIYVPLIEDGASRYFGRAPDAGAPAATSPPKLPLAQWRYVRETDAAQAEAFVGWLVKSHGIDAFRRFWSRLAWENLPAALETAYGRTAAELGAAWQAAAGGEPVPAR